MEDRLSSGSSVDVIDEARGRCRSVKVAPLACATSVWLRTSRVDVVGVFPIFLLRRRARTSAGMVQWLCDDGFGLVRLERSAVGVADDVGHAPGHHSPEPLGEVEPRRRGGRGGPCRARPLGRSRSERVAGPACGRCRRRARGWCAAARTRLWSAKSSLPVG